MFLHLQLEIKNGILLKFDFVCVTFFVVSHSILLAFDFFQMTREFQSWQYAPLLPFLYHNVAKRSLISLIHDEGFLLIE